MLALISILTEHLVVDVPVRVVGDADELPSILASISRGVRVDLTTVDDLEIRRVCKRTTNSEEERCSQV